MKVSVTHPSKTEAEITIIPTKEELAKIKSVVLKEFNTVKVPGFRPGKAPADLLEKSLEPSTLQSRFLESAVEQLYFQAVEAQNIRVVDRPEISIIKFVPFDVLEFKAKVQALGNLKVGNYKRLKINRPEVKITAEQVSDVISSLQTQLAEKMDVSRAAKDGDQLWIDFEGVDAKGKPVAGADGKDYPLVLGSKTFIPGFEENLVGVKPSTEKTFTLTFPKDYGVKALANNKVTFTCFVTKVQEIVKLKADDDFAAKAGPFKTIGELKVDIKKQLGIERGREAERDWESALVQKIADNTTMDMPETLINDQVEHLMTNLRQNLAYRGQTIQEFLESEGKTEEEYRAQVLKPEAENRTKGSLVLAEIADIEGITVHKDEIDARLSDLKAQYQDQAMQAELDNPQARRDVAAKILTEKTLVALKLYQ